jgi:hypothetical protein
MSESKDGGEAKRQPISWQQAVDDCGWLGPIIAIHTIGQYDIVEHWHNPASNDPDRNTYRCFSPFIDGKRTGCSFNSMDEALVGAIARRHDGANTRADLYFVRGIGAEATPEAMIADLEACDV